MMSKNKILVVDDEPHLLRSLTFVLNKEGYQVSMAGDGEEALNKIAEDRPDLIFLDIMMPKKNGYEVLEIIRNIPELKDIYVIILSAKGSDNERAKALSCGANEFISKPFSPIEAAARVKYIIKPTALAEKTMENAII
jgi:DNA-binding response OmpR family regulator